jgi:glycosyltransferase involved in cell wall biosynthesis
MGKLAARSALFEWMRALSNRQASRSSALRNCVRKSSTVIASNKETFDKLLVLRGEADGMHQLFPAFFTNQEVNRLRCDPTDKPTADPIRLFAGGNIIGSKGLIFALEALRVAAQQGTNWRLTVGGYGPEVPFLKRKARAFGIDQWIDFHMGFSGEDYITKLRNSHVFILPSFRENAGITMLEAMLAGCVPVIIDASAQAGVVNESCGFKIPAGKAEDIAAGLANAVIRLAQDPWQRVAMGRAASALVANSFREDTYVNNIEEIYAGALERWRNKRAC